MIVETMLTENKMNIILIGSINKQDSKNIFDFEKRKAFILKSLPHTDSLKIYGIPDFSTDTEWLETLLTIPEIQQAKDIILYCGDKENDYAVQAISTQKDIFQGKTLTIHEISRDILPISGTQVRENISLKNIKKLQESIPKNVFEDITKDIKI